MGSLKLRRTAGACDVQFKPGGPRVKVPADGELVVPEESAQSFLRSDGSPDEGWEIVGGDGRLGTTLADALLDDLDQKIAAPKED